MTDPSQRTNGLQFVPDGCFWAKTGPSGWHPLSAHLLDVAAVIHVLFVPGAALTARAAHMADANGLQPLPVRELATYLALVHDIGKAHHGFQEQRTGFGEMRRSSHVQRFIADLRHAGSMGTTSAGLMALRTAILQPLNAGSLDEAFLLASLGFAHHGRPWSAPRQAVPVDWRDDWYANTRRDPIAHAMHLVTRATTISGLTGLPRALSPAESQLFAGALTLADWIGSTEEIFPFAPEMERDVDGYWNWACERARLAMDASGTLRPLPNDATSSTNWSALFPHLAGRASALQDHVMQAPLPAPGEIVVIESDTGSGKTEAALGLYGRLRAAGRVDGLFFALPTRATASAMEARVRAFAQAWCPEAASNIVLAAGGAPEAGTSWQPSLVDDDDREARAISHWASRSLTKAFAGELVVGTIDQALLASLPVKHAHLRLAALSRLLIVVDELHAYDSYMLALLSRLTEYMRAGGGVVVAMSATLATDVTYELAGVSAAPRREEAMHRAFPCVTYGGADGVLREYALAAAEEREREYQVSEIGADEVVARASTAARSGARVLVLRNTVGAVVATLEGLCATAAESVWGPTETGPAPYHSRFTRADRGVLDAAVRRDFGIGSTTTGRILVATQVAEQSLDVDFDLLITDLCPIDVLLQRLGRVHRHDRARLDAFRDPRALVITPDRPFDEVLEGALPRSWARTGLGSVYDDLAVLALTQQLIRRTPSLAVPRRNRKMVEEVYHRESREDLVAQDPRWEVLLNRQLGAAMGQRSIANRWRLPLLTEPYAGASMTELFRMSLDEELKLRSRLGDDKIRLEFAEPVPSHFATNAGESHVDVEWLKLGLSAGDAVPAVEVVQLEHDFTFTAGLMLGTYSRYGWRFERRTRA